MRVVHIYKDFFPVLGGIETMVRTLATGLAKQGVQVTVLVTNAGGKTVRQEQDGYQVIKAGRWFELGSNPVSLALPWELQRLRPDIVHVHMPYPWGEVSALLTGHPRIVATYHSDVVRQRLLYRFYAPIQKLFLQRARVIMPSTQNYLELSAVLQRVRRKCLVIPFGIDPTPFYHVDPQAVAHIRTTYGSPLVLFVGRFRYYKGLPYLVEAVAKLPEVRLLLIGGGPAESQVRAAMIAAGLEGRAHMLPDVPDEELPAYYHACDVFCLPSSHHSEGFGIVLLEAMACGKPLITTELGTGTSFVNLHGETGLVVPPRDSQALASALRRLLEDPAYARQLGERARERLHKHFTAEVMVERIAAVYQSVYTEG
jgi:glycosyltransferase involved in cell wall biosynthesis